jgi:hypothetical protein
LRQLLPELALKFIYIFRATYESKFEPREM